MSSIFSCFSGRVKENATEFGAGFQAQPAQMRRPFGKRSLPTSIISSSSLLLRLLLLLLLHITTTATNTNDYFLLSFSILTILVIIVLVIDIFFPIFVLFSVCVHVSMHYSFVTTGVSSKDAKDEEAVKVENIRQAYTRAERAKKEIITFMLQQGTIIHA